MTPRSLVLVTVDCLRADHVGSYGYQRPTTPFLDSLAGESLMFRNAIVGGSPTYYSLPAILASRYPLALGRDLLGLAPDETTIASVLEESGFATAAFCAGNPYISARFGYDRGFRVFCDFLDLPEFLPETQVESAGGFREQANQALSRACYRFPPLRAVYDEIYFQYCQRVSRREPQSLDSLRRFPAADFIVGQAISWLRQNSGGRFFLWLHLMDPHAPYFPKPAALKCMGDDDISSEEALYLNSYWNRADLSKERLAKRREQVIKLYDAGIRFADEQIGRLASALVELNVWDKCALAVTADHGEEFLDHGGRFHAPFSLFQEVVRVPLQLRVPGLAGAAIQSPTSLLDLGPTLLDVLDLPAPADFHGRSLWNAQRLTARSQPVITECVRGSTNPFQRESRVGPRILAIRKQNYKLVMDFSSGAEKLFDLESDPKECNPLPLETAVDARRDLLECAKKHVAESHQSRDFDRRRASLLRDLRLEWAHSTANASN